MNDIEAAISQIAIAADLEALDAVRVYWLGKSGILTEQLKLLGKLSPDERKARGEQVNQAKERLQIALAARKSQLEDGAYNARMQAERVDVTMPGRDTDRGNLHPITRTLDRTHGSPRKWCASSGGSAWMPR